MTKSTWLQEVEDDATRIQTRRFNEYFEDQQLKVEKAEAKSAKQSTVSKENADVKVTEKGTKN